MDDGIIYAKSFFYLITYMVLFISVLCYKKTELKQNIVIWLSLSVIIIMCLNACVAVLYSLVGIKISIFSLSFSNIIIAVLLGFRTFRDKEVQRYYFSVKDLIIVILLCVISICIGLSRFSFDLNINYLTSDPSQHFQFACDIINSGKIGSMFFAALNNAIIIETMLPVFSGIAMVKSFIIADIMMFALSGLVFYALIEEFLTKHLTYFLAFFFTVYYLMCYPLNNLIFGFVYLGIGVSLIGYLIYMAKITFLEDRSINKKSVPLLALGTLGLILCYSLFAPIAYVSLAIMFGYYFWKKREWITRETLLYLLLVFIIPGMIGVYFSYFKMFADGVTVQSGISTEGYIYRDVYSNFILIIPLTIYMLINSIKNKKVKLETILFLFLVCFMLFLFIDGIFYGKVSSYYFFKNYYLLWLIAEYLAFQGLIKLFQENKPLFISIIIIWAGLFSLYQFNIEQKIQNRNINFMPLAHAVNYFDLYNENLLQIKSDERVYDEDKIELFKYVRSFKEDHDVLIPITAYWEDVYWYEGLTNQRLKEYYDWKLEDISFIDKLAKEKIEYVVVLNNSEIYQNNTAYFDALETVFKNDAGALYHINEVQ